MQDPDAHEPTAMASQSFTVAPDSRRRPVTDPRSSSAKSTASPESFRAQNRPGIVRLAATPLASLNSGRRVSADGSATYWEVGKAVCDELGHSSTAGAEFAEHPFDGRLVARG